MKEVFTQEEYGKIVAKNLKRILYENDRTQADVARDLGLPKTTVSGWLTGKRTPRMKHIDMLCHYFNVSRADIMDEPQKQVAESITLEFENLNEEGRRRLMEYARLLALDPMYKKDRP